MMRVALCIAALPATAPARAENCPATAEAHRVAALDATRGRAALRCDYPECPLPGAAIVEWRDVLRRAALRSGSDDSAFAAETYSDARGRPRFAYVNGGAVAGARPAQRIAIGADGRRICDARRVTAAGYTFANPWPDALLPLAAARDGPCPQEQESEHP